MSTPSAAHQKVSQGSRSKLRNRKKKDGLSVYFAGDLWTHKDLIGNALLGQYIKKVSQGHYCCLLPQDIEEPVNRTKDIRNSDLKHLMMCDMAIFNFDGSCLDSGTVVEFIYAKMLDLPCVILRTDFRASGEGAQGQDPWNLMATHWPRSKVLKLHGMVEYQKARTAGTLSKTIDRLYTGMATQIVESLDAVRNEMPLVSSVSRMSQIYEWAILCPGSGFAELFTKADVQELLAAKTEKGLLTVQP